MDGDLHSWLMPAAITLALFALALIYSRGWYRLRIDLPYVVGVWRFVAFLSGLVAVWAVLATPLAHLDHKSLTAHMVQHLVLMNLAAPSILLGDPTITLAHTLPRPYALSVTNPLLHFVPARRGWHIFFNPVFSWLVGTVCVISWHVPTAFALGMSSERWHEFEHATFFVAGLLFWWPVVQPWRSFPRYSRWSIPLYLFLATLPCDALSAFLTFCGRVVYSAYVSGAEPFNDSALRDQESAGALMWVWVTLVYLFPAVVITVQHLSEREPAPLRQLSKYRAF
jgi:cytochrome c oxidase assembly factor CtaG